MASQNIEPDVLAVLKCSQILTDRVILPDGQLERTLYAKVNKVLANAGGKWNTKAKAHLFARNPQETLAEALENGKSVSIQQTLQAFFTPPDIAKEMVDWADVHVGNVVLEPSAGEGNLVTAILEAGAVNVTAIELDKYHCEVMGKKAPKWVEIIQGDFLKWDNPGKAPFDRFIMNPPFTKGSDVEHVSHALSMLEKGGILVAIIYPSSEDKLRQVAVKLGCRDVAVNEIPAGAFKESGTPIATKMVRITV